MTLLALIVDDETPARSELRHLLGGIDGVEVAGEAASAREALVLAERMAYDVVFLDISMPGGAGGIETAKKLAALPNRPTVVFVTAHDDRAIQAFSVEAVDYLLKPVDEQRLADTLDRVRQRLAEKRGIEEVGRLKEVLAEVAPDAAENMAESDDAPASNRFEKLINIKDRGQIFRVDVDTIERIDAAGDYMCIYTGDNTLILRETMKDLEKRLDPRRFQRVHRSTIVNLDLVRQVKPHTNGECFLVLDSGAQVKVSRSYREVVARFVH